MCLTIFQNEKTSFKAFKAIETYGFGQKLATFRCFFFGNMGQENVFYNILEPKNALLRCKNKTFKYRPGECVLGHCRTEKTHCQAIKTRSSKSRKIEIFPNFNLLFSSKLAIFPPFFWRQYRPGKCVLRYSRTNKRLCRPLKQEVQKVEKLRFF